MEVSIASYFDNSIEEIFNPRVTYEGNYPIKSDVLRYASKIKDGKNLFDEFMKKKYVGPINNYLSNLNRVGEYEFYLLSDLDEENGRTLKVSGLLFLIQFCGRFIGECPELPEDLNEVHIILKDFFRKYRKDISRLLNNEMDEDTKRIDENLKKKYLIGEEYKKKLFGKNYKFMSYTRYLELTKENIGSFLIALRYLIPLFDEKIDLKELEECLDLDKFYLAMSKQLIEVSKSVLNEYGKVHSSFVHVEKYIMAIKELRSKVDYNVSVKTCLNDGQVITVSVDDVIREYNEIKILYPNFNLYSLEDDGITDYRDIKNVMDLTQTLEEYISSKKLEASWEFIRRGTKDIFLDKQEDLMDKIDTKHSKKKKTKEEKEQLVVDRMNFLDETNYLYKMTGKNNFTGYIGYLYSNGVVVFEKYYKNYETREPVESNATYVMNFNNFVQMSMLTKSEIMNYIRQGGNGVSRIYHTSTWCKRMMRVINGNVYDDKVVDAIDRLIDSGKITKKLK